jgi:DNA-binding winged helix-turn-helix (wHTH) protein
MELRLLGTTEVVTGGTRPPVGGPRQRAVLADLALHAGRALVTAQLVEDLWGESPPASAVHTVEAYISRLRRAFFVPREPSVLLTTGLGYLLDVNPAQVDALQFGQLSAAGREALVRATPPVLVSSLSPMVAVSSGADPRSSVVTTPAATTTTTTARLRARARHLRRPAPEPSGPGSPASVMPASGCCGPGERSAVSGAPSIVEAGVLESGADGLPARGASSSGACTRMSRSSSRSSRPGSMPRSSVNRARASWKAARASACRPER